MTEESNIVLQQFLAAFTNASMWRNHGPVNQLVTHKDNTLIHLNTLNVCILFQLIENWQHILTTEGRKRKQQPNMCISLRVKALLVFRGFGSREIR